MKLSKNTVLELKQILREEFNLYLNDQDLENLAHSLVGYFSLLKRIENRHRFGNSSRMAIDTSGDSVLDKREVK